MCEHKDTFIKAYPDVSVSLLNHTGIEAYVTMIKETVHVSLLVTTKQLDVLFAGDQEETLSFGDILTHINNRGNLLQKAAETRGILPIASKDRYLSVKGLFYQGEVVGYLFILHETELDESKHTFLYRFSELIIPWVISEMRMQDNDQDYQKQFVYDLLHNHFDSHMDMNEKASRWGWDFTHGYRLMLVQADPSVLDMPLLKKYAEVFFVKLGYHAITVTLEDQLTILYQPHSKHAQDQNSPDKEVAQRLMTHLASLNEESQLKIGTGHHYPSALFLYRTYQEAKMAMKLYGDRAKKHQVIHYDELGVVKLLGHLRYELLADYQQEQLQALMAFDHETGEELTDTLENYFKNNGNIKACAAELHIHPNTLRYRLSKVESLLQLSLKDYQAITKLSVAFLIKNAR